MPPKLDSRIRPGERVLVAMSGGVDSSVAAALLRDAGCEVVGVTLHLWDYPDDGSVKSRCCAPEDIHDARRVCDSLGVPHYAFDRRDLFLKEVVEPFVDAYLDGTTPSPCVRCNRGVKMAELVRIADHLGARWLATGHYARLRESAEGPQLICGADTNKDQSYFLHMLDSATLSRLVFPLGELTKAEVREQAVTRCLPGAHKGESQELCFVPTGRYDAFVEDRAKGRVRPGAIVDDTGRAVSDHGGIHRYTIGQRRNLGVAVGKRTYVVDLDQVTGQVTLGAREQLLSGGAKLVEFSLAKDVKLPLQCEARVRYRGALHKVSVSVEDDHVVVVFDEPVSAVVPGQYVVLQASERILGGGRILSSLPGARCHTPLPSAPGEV